MFPWGFIAFILTLLILSSPGLTFKKKPYNEYDEDEYDVLSNEKTKK